MGEMRQITTLNNFYKQVFRVSIDGYSAVEISLEFKPQQYAWFMSLTWGDFSLNNERVAIAPNLLRQFKNILPFGIMISNNVTIVDPFSVDAWLSGLEMYLLSESELDDVEAVYVK
jgi:hypothetical protein